MSETEMAAADAIPEDEIANSTVESWPLGFMPAMSNRDYQQSPGLSNSGLELLRKSPWHYHALHHLELPDWLAEDVDAEERAALFAGTLCHCATLEPESFDARYVVGPALNKNTNAWKAFVEAAKPRQAITRKQYEVAHAQAAALRNLPDVAEILEGGECEVSGYWRDAATQVLCRCRPDCLNRQFGTAAAPASVLLDVKSTQDATEAAVQNAIARYGYHYQADWYSRGVEAITGAPVAGFVFAFVEAAYPFACRVVDLDPKALELAHRDNNRALHLYASCERANTWPGYSQVVGMVSLPRWAWSDA